VRGGFHEGGILYVYNRDELSEKCNPEKKEKGQERKEDIK